MRRVTRLPLDSATSRRLMEKQLRADQKQSQGILNVEGDWNATRKTKPLQVVADKLKSMAGVRERCMYCLDSHGTDIEHFWPKAVYPNRMYSWPNYLLCCSDCNRIKGNTFPMVDGEPLLVDPTVEESWLYLDFEPTTGIITARFDPDAKAWAVRGTATVDTLQLDRREALAAGHLKTLRRLKNRVNGFLADDNPDAESLTSELLGDDDHGLLGWCVFGTGWKEDPFRMLFEQHPYAWEALQMAVRKM